jgi:hypothetical protein
MLDAYSCDDSPELSPLSLFPSKGLVVIVYTTQLERSSMSIFNLRSNFAFTHLQPSINNLRQLPTHICKNLLRAILPGHSHTGSASRSPNIACPTLRSNTSSWYDADFAT